MPPSPWRGGDGGGVSFLQQLKELTGANIAASNNLTGNAALGGDWNLQVTTGKIKPPLAFVASAIASYQGVLATFNVAAGDATGLINAINSANDEVTNPGADTINLAAGTTFLTLKNSTVSGNTAGGNGGGIRNRNQANITIVNSTIAFNTSSASGGGIFNGANATVRNSIVIGNTGSNPDVSGTFTSNNFNIIGDTTGSTGFVRSAVLLFQPEKIGSSILSVLN